MKFLIGAQLPIKLSRSLKDLGFESIHTLDLPNKKKTSDKEIIEFSIENEYIVISKDTDFYISFLQKSEPHKLIILKVGNLSADALISIFINNIELIVNEIKINSVVEINNKNIITII